MLSFLLNFFLPNRCRLCEKEGYVMCPECEKTIVFAPKISTFRDFSVLSFFEYTAHNPLAKAIKSGKYQHSESLFPLLTEKIIPLLPENFGKEKVIFVPVPLHWIRKNERGYNQSEKIANTLQKAFPQSVVISLVQRIRNTPQQAKLAKKERLNNLHQAFAIDEKKAIKCSRQAHVIIIDDIITTGSTIQEMVLVLQKAGFQNISALTLGKTL